MLCTYKYLQCMYQICFCLEHRVKTLHSFLIVVEKAKVFFSSLSNKYTPHLHFWKATSCVNAIWVALYVKASGATGIYGDSWDLSQPIGSEKGYILKFRFSEKATKFEKNLLMVRILKQFLKQLVGTNPNCPHIFRRPWTPLHTTPLR